MNKPVSTVVISLEVPAAPAAPAPDLKAAFEQLLLAPCIGLGYAVQEPGGLNLTVTLPPDSAPDSALRRIALACADYEAKAAPLKVRGLIHFGTVFRNEGTGGRVTYLGSALRAAQTTLHRVAATGLFVSKDFVEYMRSAGINFGVELLAGGFEDARPIRLTERRTVGGEVPGSDPEFLTMLKKRLAEEIGPFAGPLVDNTKHSTMSAKELVNALSHEIDRPEARQAFEAEMIAYIKSRTR